MKRILVLPILVTAVAAALLGAVAAGESPEVVPDEVEIGVLADWFAPVVFSHGFHAELTGACGDCHHHSDDLVPPCSDCHDAGPETPGAGMPGLKVAYHQQCIGCHQEMGSGPLDCEGCHARRRLPAGPPLGVAAH